MMMVVGFFDGSAGGRWVERTSSREVTKQALSSGRLSPLNSEDLLERRVARLQRVHHIREATPSGSSAGRAAVGHVS